MLNYILSLLKKEKYDIDIDTPYTKSRTELHMVAQKLLDEFAEDQGVSYNWVSDDKVALKRSGAEGYLAITDKVIQIRIKLSWWARPFKGKAEDFIHDWIAKNPL